MNKDFQNEQIDAYLRNELSAKEKANFEQAIEKDPILKSELEFQKDIVESIRFQRKMELKQRLDKVKIDSASVFTLPKTALVGTLIVASIITSILVFFDDNTQKTKNTLSANNSNKEQIIKQKNKDLADSEEKQNSSNEVLKDNAQNSDEVSQVKINNLNKSTEKPNENASDLNNSPVNKDSDNFSKIDAITSSKKKSTDNLAEIKDKDAEKGVFDGKNETNIESIAAKHKLSYQYYNNELFLYNNVSRGQEIRITSGNTKRLFLYYEKNYYELNENQVEKKELKAITNPDLIKELNKLRKDLYVDKE